MLFLVFCCACSPGMEPVPLHTFALQSIAGVSLPAPEAFNTACGSTVVADTLLLYAGNTGMRRTTRDVPTWNGAVDPVTCEPAASSPRKRVRARNEFTYRLTGARIEIDFPCDDTASCIAPPHLAGTMAANDLTFDSSRIWRTPLVYIRVSSSP